MCGKEHYDLDKDERGIILDQGKFTDRGIISKSSGFNELVLIVCLKVDFQLYVIYKKDASNINKLD